MKQTTKIGVIKMSKRNTIGNVNDITTEYAITVRSLVDGELESCFLLTEKQRKEGYANFEKLGEVVRQQGRLPHCSKHDRNLAMKIAKAYLLKRCGFNDLEVC